MGRHEAGERAVQVDREAIHEGEVGVHQSLKHGEGEIGCILRRRRPGHRPRERPGTAAGMGWSPPESLRRRAQSAPVACDNSVPAWASTTALTT